MNIAPEAPLSLSITDIILIMIHALTLNEFGFQEIHLGPDLAVSVDDVIVNLPSKRPGIRISVKGINVVSQPAPVKLSLILFNFKV